MPKQFAERSIIGSNNQYFVFIPLVGANGNAYALTPEHAKELLKNLSTHVANFEKNIRPIQEGVPSPIQKQDVDSSGKDGSKK